MANMRIKVVVMMMKMMIMMVLVSAQENGASGVKMESFVKLQFQMANII